MRVLTNFIVLHYDDVRYTDLEIEEAMDELDEEEMTPINEGVSELIDDLNLSEEDWFYSVEEEIKIQSKKYKIQMKKNKIQWKKNKNKRLCEFFSSV
jgi:hypothetical protein